MLLWAIHYLDQILFTLPGYLLHAVILSFLKHNLFTLDWDRITLNSSDAFLKCIIFIVEFVIDSYSPVWWTAKVETIDAVDF